MKSISRFLLILFVLLLLPALCLALVDFEYPSMMYLSPDADLFTLYTNTNYQVDVDPSLYDWSSTDEDVARVYPNGKIIGKWSGRCRIIGTPKIDGIEKIDIELFFPDFIYGDDYVEIDSPDGVFHEHKVQGKGISTLDYNVSGGVFKCETASNISRNGPDALYLKPIKPGKGTLTYIFNSRTRIPITVVVKESAFYTPEPVPTATPVPASTEAHETESLPNPRDYSGSVLQKLYSSYDYSAAKNTPEAYKGTSVYAAGKVFMKKILDDGWGYALFFESKSEKAVYITLPPGSVPTEGIDIGDNIEVYGVAQTLTNTTPSYPVILTTMKIVNHGE